MTDGGGAIVVVAPEIVVPGAPPAAIIETRPPPPGPGPLWYWQPGHWRWDGGRYAWYHGIWVQRPARYREWVAPHWEPHPHGWIFVEGHWR